MQTNTQNNLLQIGEILRPRGLKGELKVRALNGDANRFNALKFVFLDNKKIKIIKCSASGTGTYIFLENINSIEQAESLRGKFLYLPKEEIAAEDNGEGYFVSDLIGMQVLTEKDELLGTIKDVGNYGAGDIIECIAPEGSNLLDDAVVVGSGDSDNKNKKSPLQKPAFAKDKNFEKAPQKPQTYRFVFLEKVVKTVDIQSRQFIVYKDKWQQVVVFD